MKLRIFNKGNGWYTTATNYKDKEDKAYVNVKFMRDQEPYYNQPADSPFVSTDIFIDEGKLDCYKGKVGLFVFRWSYVNEDGKPNEEDTNVKFGDVQIDEKDLPFF